jgi:hypothetical protein
MENNKNIIKDATIISETAAKIMGMILKSEAIK